MLPFFLTSFSIILMACMVYMCLQIIKLEKKLQGTVEDLEEELISIFGKTEEVKEDVKTKENLTDDELKLRLIQNAAKKMQTGGKNEKTSKNSKKS
jgi:predicted Holliday junction resolvase-like endonuclease